MNKALTIALKRDEIKKMMARVAKCDRRLAANITGVVADGEPGEPEAARKERLMIQVALRLEEIKNLEAAK